MHHFNFILALSLISCYGADYIHHSIHGNLSSISEINIKVFVENSLGLILYSTDGTNRLLVRLAWDYIEFAFNKNGSKINLNDLCQIKEIKKVFLDITISNEMEFSTSCNNHTKTIRRKEFMHVEWDNYPTSSTKGNVSFWMGNVGLHKNFKGHDIYPSKLNLRGCLEYFLFNKRLISFPEDSDSFQKTCTNECSSKLCNDGKCLKRTSSGVQCDCSNIALNGDFCNKNLREYGNRKNKTLQVITLQKNVHVKLSFNYEGNGHYCLMDFINRNNSNVLVFVNQSKLFIGRETLDDIKPKEDYFINLVINETHIKFKIRNKDISHEIKNVTKILIGFSQTDKCKDFKGKYDFLFNASQIQIIPDTDHKPWIQEAKNFLLQFVGVYVVGFMLIVLFITFNVLYRQRKKKVSLNANNQNVVPVDLDLEPSISNSDEIVYDALNYLSADDIDNMTVRKSTFHGLPDISIEIDIPEPPPRRI